MRHTPRFPPLLLAIVVASAALATPGLPTQVARAAGVTMLFLDSARFVDDNQSVETIDGPAAATWDGSKLSVEYFRYGDGPVVLTVAPKLGDDLEVGTYSFALGDATAGQPGLRFEGCDGGGFEVLELAPPAEASVPATITAFAAKFRQGCGTDLIGQARLDSSVGVKAFGFQAIGHAPDELRIEADVPVGEMEPPHRFTLMQRGSEPVTLGTAAIVTTVHTGFADGWSITADTCSGRTIGCSISVSLSSWIPERRSLAIRIPADTDRGWIQVDLDGAVQATTFVPIEPTRIVDTRIGLGIGTALRHREWRPLVVVNRRSDEPDRNVPEDALAVVGNLTVTKQTGSGFVALSTIPTNYPKTSTINVPPGDTRANGVMLRLRGGAVGATWVGQTGSSAHVIFDVTGYFVPTQRPALPKSGNFENAGVPVRVLDTRSGLGLAGSLVANTSQTLAIDLPTQHDGATAVGVNVTVVGATAAGYLSLGPSEAGLSTTSVINFKPGDVRANNAVVRLGPGSTVSLRFGGPAGAKVHVVMDVTGSFGSGTSGFVPLIPHRAFDSRHLANGKSPYPASTTPSPILIADRSNDPARRVPFGSHGLNFVPVAIVANATVVAPTRAGYVSFDGESPPATSSINVPAGDVRANGIVAAYSGGEIQAAYVAPTGATTHLLVDTTGYFTNP